MSSPHGGDSFDSHTRKRVGKACDRCRLKKSKCDGNTPCTRCRLDNAICVFGERKKSVDRVFPKGYVEMIEQQQITITNGLRQMYYKLLDQGLWEGAPLEKVDGHPLTHDILSKLGVIDTSDPDKSERFEDDLAGLEQRLFETNGPSSRQRKATPSDSSSSRAQSVKSEPSEVSMKSPASAYSSPASRTSSVSSISSRKRGPDTPNLEIASPALQQKRVRLPENGLRLFAPVDMSSPESVTGDTMFWGGYEMPSITSPVANSQYSLPNQNQGFYSFPAPDKMMTYQTLAPSNTFLTTSAMAGNDLSNVSLPAYIGDEFEQLNAPFQWA